MKLVEVPIWVECTVQSERMDMRMEIQEVTTGVQAHHRAGFPVMRKGVFNEIVPSAVGCGVEFGEESAVKLKKWS